MNFDAANPIPPGPKDIVSPLYTAVVGVAPGPMVKVVPPISTSDEPISKKVMPPAVTSCVVGLNGNVNVVDRLMVSPPGPAVIVFPSIVAVLFGASGPTVRVMPSITAIVEPISET